MSISTHSLVARLDPTSVARTRIPTTTEQAKMYQAFGVLERGELQAVHGPFTLPEEGPCLDLAVVSAGVHASFLDFPRLQRSEAALEDRARLLAELQLHIWSGISNDREMYARQFAPAFVFGYRLGDSILQEANAEGQARLLEGVCPMPAPAALSSILDILQDRMKEMGVIRFTS